MAAFRVGQRVKLVKSIDLISRAKNYGWQGRISEIAEFPKGVFCMDGTPLSRDMDCTVEWDGEANPHFQHTSQLEPIQPEGAQPAKWEDCMWQPSAELLAECAA